MDSNAPPIPEMSGGIPDNITTRRSTSPPSSEGSGDHVFSREDPIAPVQQEHHLSTQRRQSFFVVSDRRRDDQGNVIALERINIKPAQRTATFEIGKPKKGPKRQARLSSPGGNPRTPGNSVMCPEAQIPLPESKGSSRLSLTESVAPPVSVDAINHDLRSSLEVIAQQGNFPARPTTPSLNGPLPEPTEEHLEEPEETQIQPAPQLIGDVQEQPRPDAIPPAYSSYRRMVPLRTFNWEQIVTFASEILPHLGYGKIRSGSRHEPLHITFIDYGSSFREPPITFQNDFVRDETVVRALGNIPDDIRRRVVIVEDLSPRSIKCLGTCFGTSPEFFEEHLINSGYQNGNYDDPPANTWATSHMNKAYVSMKWHRPVFRLPVVPYSKQDVKDLLDPAEGRLVYTSDFSSDLSIFQTETNIFRSEWELWTDPKTTTRQRRVCGWEERVSIWTQNLPERNCQIVIILLDPIPRLGEGIERNVLAASRIRDSVDHGSDGSLSDEYKHSADEEALNKLAEHLQKRLTQPTASRLRRMMDFVVNGVTRRKPEDAKDDASMMSQAFEIVNTTVFKKERTRSIFEQISSRANFTANFEDAFQSPRLMEKLREHLHTTRSTKEDYLERLYSEEEYDNPDHYFGILNPLFQIIRQDALSLVKLLHKTLDDINAEILDEDKMEENLSLWRELITRSQLELRELRKSMASFFSFFRVLDVGAQSTRPEPQIDPRKDISSGFSDISKQIDETLQRLSIASSSLTSNMALLDSRRSIAEAQAVTKLTELAFFFIPLTFAASLFGMQIEQFENRAPLSTFIAIGIGFTALAYLVRLVERSSWVRSLGQAYRASMKIYADNRQKPVQRGSVPASLFVQWLGYEIRSAVVAFVIGLRTWIVEGFPKMLATFWLYSEFIINTILMVSVVAAGPIAVLWTRSMDHSAQIIITFVIIVPVIALIAIPYWRHADPKVRGAIPRFLKTKFKHAHFSKLWVVLLLCTALAIPIVPLAIIWTRPIAPGIQAAVTIVMVLIVLIILITLGIYRLVSLARMNLSDTDSGSGIGSLVSD